MDKGIDGMNRHGNKIMDEQQLSKHRQPHSPIGSEGFVKLGEITNANDKPTESFEGSNKPSNVT